LLLKNVGNEQTLKRKEQFCLNKSELSKGQNVTSEKAYVLVPSNIHNATHNLWQNNKLYAQKYFITTLYQTSNAKNTPYKHHITVRSTVGKYEIYFISLKVFAGTSGRNVSHSKVLKIFVR
jgi:hypothetical protein